MEVGIESINAYGAQTYINIRELFEHRQLDLHRFDNLMMEKKSVALPCEDPVTNAVNAAKPIIDALRDEEKHRIELLISATESGLDFGKSISTYIHHHLNLDKRCRLFEVKQACYAGTAGLHMAANFVASNVSPGAKALVIATDIARAAAKGTYAEPSQGVIAVAMLVSRQPEILELDFGANGYYSYEVMDTCRPDAAIEVGDPDLSLLSYLDCLEGSYRHYLEKVEGADWQNTFQYLVFHTPFAGMVKGAHRRMMRKLQKVSNETIEEDFQKRVAPSLNYGMQVGNGYSASLYFALCSLIDNAPITTAQRLGLFSYGSGCSSEFYSGIVTPKAKAKLAGLQIASQLAGRYHLSMAEYDHILDLNMQWMFGIQDKTVNHGAFAEIYQKQLAGRQLLVLTGVKNYHREYAWS